MKKKAFRIKRKTFQFKIAGQKNTLKVRARRRDAKKDVTLTLTIDDLNRSEAMDGAGDTQRCAMAVCAKRQSQSFPHPVLGYIDWTYRTADVVSKIDKDGLPSECIYYEHRDEIAPLFDTKEGRKKLRAYLNKHGERKIVLTPPRDRRGHNANNKEGKKVGARGPRRKPSLTGANLRFAVAQAGGIDQPEAR
jgi:hypothetical protein